jgi:hypothetical protein
MERARTSLVLAVMLASALLLSGASVVSAQSSAQSTPALGRASSGDQTARTGSQTAASPTSDFLEQINWSNWALVLVAIGASWIARRTLDQIAIQAAAGKIAADAAKESADTARDALKETTRPWVSSEIVNMGDLVYSKDGVALYLRIKLRNTGHSVATQVWPHLKMFSHALRADYSGTDTSKEIINRQHALADEVKTNFQNRTFGLVLFPGDEREVGVSVGASWTDINKITDVRGVCFTILKCVDYRFHLWAT